jgi:hypothetical protein
MAYTLTADGRQYTGTTTVYGAVEHRETRAAIAQHHHVPTADAQLTLTPKPQVQR